MQHYLGMEETPYSGGTLTTMENTNHRLSLPIVQHELGTFTGLTNISGTRNTSHAIEFGRLKIVGAMEEEWDTALSSGDFDCRIDYDLVTTQSDTSGTGVARMLQVYYSAGNYVEIRLLSTNAIQFYRNTASGGDTAVGSAASGIGRFGTIRITRAGNVFAAYFWSYATNAWVQIGSNYTNAHTGSPKVRIVQSVSGGSVKWWTSNLRSVFPSSTSGNWESADLDTEDGYRGISWYTVAGTGTVTVEVKTASTQGGLSSASYAAATSGAAVTPSASNRWVKVKVSIASGSTTAASPEVGPVLVDSTLASANATALMNTLMCGWIRHTNANNRLALAEAAVGAGSTTTALYSRIGNGLGEWIAAGNNPSWTWRSTTVDLAAQLVAGFDQTTADLSGVSQLQVEAAQALPGIYAARASLTITGTQKTNWCDRIHAQIGSLNSTNWNSFALLNRQSLNLLNAADAGFETTGNNLPYASSTLDTNWSNLSTSYRSDGIWDDVEPGISEHFDVYSSIITGDLSRFNSLAPSYVQVTNGTIAAAIQRHRRNLLHMADDRGDAYYMGRSVHGASIMQAGWCAMMVAKTTATLYGQARELLGRGIMRYLQDTHYAGFEFGSAMPVRKGNSSAIESYSKSGTINGNNLNVILIAAATSALFAATSTAYAGQSAQAHTWPDAGLAYVRGSDSTDPLLMLSGRDWDDSTSENQRSKYCGRILSPRFGQDVHIEAGKPNTQNGFWYYRDSALSSFNICSLQAYSSVNLFRTGKGVVLWRTGTAKEYSATVGGTATSTAQTDVFFAKDNHVAAFAKIVLGARTASFIAINTPVVPLASGASASNTGTGTSPRYGYQENADGLAEQVTELAGSATTTNVQTNFGTGVDRLNNQGQSISIVSGSQTGTQYAGADIALSHAAMVTATEKAYISSYSRSTDAITFQAGADEDCYLHMGSGGTNPTVGSYTLTGTVKAFSGKTGATPSYFGGGDLTAISHSGAGNLVGLGSAGNVAVEILSATTTRVWSTIGDITLHAACLPTGFNKIYAYDVDGVAVDITGSCTITPGVSVVIPSSTVTTYKFGMAQFDVQTEATIPPKMRSYRAWRV